MEPLMELTPMVIERVLLATRQSFDLPQGQRQTPFHSAAQELGVSYQTIMRWRKQVAALPGRKRRADAGKINLPYDEAIRISAYLQESHRRNGKRLASVALAAEVLRSNGEIRAEYLDPSSGEIRLLSIATITRSLRAYGLHPDQLNRPAPAVSLASRHPNHVWQIDASLCVLYYLKRSADSRQNGLRVMDHKQFYKNKPGNLDRIVNDRVWRYAISDHTSGHIYVEYVLGAESGENLCTVFINAMLPRDGEPAHGVPFMAMLDPGSANTGAVFKNLCKALRVRVLINEVGNPRAKGQVEKAHDQIEKSFESGLKFVAIDSLEALNQAAAKWRKWFNGTCIHTRHDKTRYAAWMTITPEQLQLAPELEVLRELARSEPESRKVNDKLQVSYRGSKFDVSVVPGIQNRDFVWVCRNPWRPEAAQVVTVDSDGRDIYYVIEPVGTDANGFDANAVMIDEGYARHADSPAQVASKEIEKLLMGVDTLAEAESARKEKRLAFNGAIDPWKHMDDALVGAPAYLPRRGTEIETAVPGIVANRSLDVPAALAVEAVRLNPVQLAGRLHQAMPGEWKADDYQRLLSWYPEGAMETEISAIVARFREFAAPPRLVAVGGA
jgi:hypothetical protein